MPVDTFDVVVIGAGPPGENVAEHVVRAGLSCAVIESDLVGGECSYWACMPSKALLRPAEVLAAAHAVPGVAVAADGALNASDILESRNSFASNWRDDSQVDWLEKAGAVLVRGHAQLTGERRVDVATRDGDEAELIARHAVVVSTGSRPSIPDIPGLKAADPWTSRDAASAPDVPRSLAIIGGGAVAVEMAAAWSALGSEITMLVRDDRLLPGRERFASDLVGEALTESGVSLRAETTVESVAGPDADGLRTLRTSQHDEVTATQILVATGRSPRTDDLGLHTVGLRPGEWLRVDDTGRAADIDADWLYAVGDVNGRALLTHQGKYQARQTGAAIVARAKGHQVSGDAWSLFTATADSCAVPQVVFSRPNVATVGPTFHQALAAGRPARAVDYDMSGLAGAALHADPYRGRARLVIDEARDTVVGATFVGPDAADLLHAATIAIVGDVPVNRLWHAVPAFPTVSEVWLRLLETYEAGR